MNEIFTTYAITKDNFLPVFSFLYRHKFLIPILLEATEHIKDIFGHTVKLSLALDQDPEDKFEELFIVVGTRQSAKEAIELLSELDEKWFLKILPKTRNQLNITVEVQDEF